MLTKHYFLCLICFFLLLPVSAQTQNLNVKGIILDEETKEPLIGASVTEKGTTNAAVSDLNGEYTLNLKSSAATLVISYIGYNTVEIAFNGQKTISANLSPNTQLLDDVVVIGYGSVKKSDLTGAVSSIKPNELTAYPATTVLQAMAGRAAGVQVQQNNGSPGGTISIRIRGANSIQGNNEPLYVIDGFIGGSPVMLNPNDIESMEILKDASATAIYGSRGANGVVLISTKKGKTGKTKVDFETSYSMQKVIKRMDMMNAAEYAEFTNKYLTDNNKEAYFDNAASLGEGTNWQDLVLQDAPILNSSVSVSGGNEKTKFAISASYFDQEGVVRNSDYKRFTTSMNITHDINKYISLYGSSMYSQSNRNSKDIGGSGRGNDLYGSMLLSPPTLSPYNDDGSYRMMGIAYPFSSSVLANAMNFINETSNKTINDRSLINGAISIKPIDGLLIKISGGIGLNNRTTNSYKSTQFIGSSGVADVITSRNQMILNENTINYTKTFGDHDFSALAGFTYQFDKTTSVGAGSSGFVSDVSGSYDLGSGELFSTPSSGLTEWSMLSFLSRINYSYKGKYLLTASIRADGSSRYSEGNKWGYFPSASLAWRVIEEDFMKGIDFMSNLKLRIGYGKTGSTAIDPYSTLNMLSSGKTVLADELVTTYAPSNRLPGPLKWETTGQTNVGIDIGILKNRISLTADYYVKNTKDLLNNVQLPASLGYTYKIENIGEMQNKGLEFTLDATILDGSFYWNLTSNISFNRNKIKKLYGGEKTGRIYDVSAVKDYVSILREGEPVGMFYGYKETGYDENGRITYEDLDGKGLSYEDRRKIGDPNPDFIYGINSTMSYKGFNLTLFLQGSQGNDLYNLSAISMTQDFICGHNRPRDMINNTWTPDNPNAKYPKLNVDNSAVMSDRFVEDGSYLRLKNIQLAYSLSLKKMKIHWVESAQIYVSAQNLITWTDYSGFDPEVNYSGGANSTDLGVDFYSYPVPKSWTIGVRIGF